MDPEIIKLQYYQLYILIAQLAVLVPYVIATVIIAKKASGQLAEIRKNYKQVEDGLKQAQEEFKARTRPYLALEDIRIEAGGFWSYSLRNFGWNPASDVITHWGSGQTSRSLVKIDRLPKTGDGITIFPQQNKKIRIKTSFDPAGPGAPPDYLAWEIVYTSKFGRHWTFHLLKWIASKKQYTLEYLQAGDNDPLKHWVDAASSSSSEGSGLASGWIAPATPADSKLPPFVT